MDPARIAESVGVAVTAVLAYVAGNRAKLREHRMRVKELERDTAAYTVDKRKVFEESQVDYLDRLERRLEILEARVLELETERGRMVAWMHHNDLDWPPPRDFLA